MAIRINTCLFQIEAYFVKALTAGLLVFCFVGFIPSSVGAEDSKFQASLSHHLDRLIAESDHHDNSTKQQNAHDVIMANFNTIISHPGLTIRAMILARQSDHLDLALDLGSAAIDHLNRQEDSNLQTPRLLYEMAYTLLLAGECSRARPVFQVLAHPDFIAPYWLKVESQKGLMLCPDGQYWYGDVVYDFSTDDNLGGLTPQKTITPETGSSLARVIDLLSTTVYVPDQLTLGTPKQSGYWVAIRPLIWRQWRQSQSIMTARFMPSIRITNPAGYEHFNLLGQLSRHQLYETTVAINRLDVFRDFREHGKGLGHTENIGALLFSAIEWQARYPVLVGGFIGQSRNKSGNSKSQIRQQGLRFTIRSGLEKTDDAPQGQPLNWSLSLEHQHQTSDDRYSNSVQTALSGQARPFAIGTFDHLSLDWALSRQRPDYPRPWLQSRHTRRDLTIGITSRHRIFDHWVDFIIRHHVIQSNDPLDPDTNLQFMIRMN